MIAKINVPVFGLNLYISFELFMSKNYVHWVVISPLLLSIILVGKMIWKQQGDCVVAGRENVRMSPLAAALPFLMSLSWFATLYTCRCFPFGCGRLGNFLKFCSWWAYQCLPSFPWLILFLGIFTCLFVYQDSV